MTEKEFATFISYTGVSKYIKENKDKYKTNLIKKAKNVFDKVVTENIKKLEAIASSG